MSLLGGAVLVSSCGGADPTDTTPTTGDATSSTVSAPSISTTSLEPTTTTSTTSTGSTAVEPCGEGPLVAGFELGPGPFFVCTRTVGNSLVDGGRVFPREGVTTAEEAILEWLKGPNAAEQAAGYQGWALSEYHWLTESLTLQRDDGTLFMDIGQWEWINNLSTSNGTPVFTVSLFGTAFSDPSVDEFVFSLEGHSCPVNIGEAEYCFPVTRDDVLPWSTP